MPGPLIWAIIAGGSALGLWGCSDDESPSEGERDLGPFLNDAGSFGNPGQGITNPNACKLPKANADGSQNYYKDVFVKEIPTQANECATVQSALEIADKGEAVVHFEAGTRHSEAFKIPNIFKKLTLLTDFTESNKERVVLTPFDSSGETIMTLEKTAPVAEGAEVNVPQVVVRDVILDGLQEGDAIRLEGGHKPTHVDEFNLQLHNVKIQDAAKGLVVGAKARVLTDNLDIDHPNQAVSLGKGVEGEFYGTTIHDMAGYSDQAVFEAKEADTVKIEGLLLSDLKSNQSLIDLKTNLAWIYGVVVMNSESLSPLINLDLDKLFEPELNQEHQIGNVLVANNQGNESLISYQTDDRATFHNIHISRNNGSFEHAIDSADNTAPSTIVNSNISDNNNISEEAVSGTDVSGATGVQVHGSNFFNNNLTGMNENIYGVDNYQIEYCGKSAEGILFNVALNTLFPNAFEINTTNHEECALASGGAEYASWTNNEDGTLGHVGISGGWKAHLMDDVYDTMNSLYKKYIQE